MATHLSPEALIHLGGDKTLQEQVAAYVGVNNYGVMSAVIRGSKSLTTYKAVIAIAKSMDKKPDEILIEKK